MPRPGERANGQHQRIARRARGLGELGFEVVAQINLVENDHRPRAAFVPMTSMRSNRAALNVGSAAVTRKTVSMFVARICAAVLRPLVLRVICVGAAAWPGWWPSPRWARA